MNKFEFYFGQPVTDDELNEAFNSYATAIEQFVQDFSYYGLAVGGEITQNSSPNMSVLVNGPCVAYDNAANRISFGTPQLLNCSVDENNQSTAVAGPSNEKWLAIFLKFVSTPSDPRVDDAGTTVFFRKVGSFQLRVVQGAEAPVGTAPRPPLRGDHVLLGDVKLIANQTSIINANISTTRTQMIYDVAGTPLAIKTKSLGNVIAAMVAAINGVNPSTQIVPAISGSPTPIVGGGSVTSAFTTVLNALNSLANLVATLPTSLVGLARLADTQTFGGQNTFNQKTTLNQTDLRDQLFQIVSDAGRALRSCADGPGADSVPGNKWKIIDELRAGTSVAGTQTMRVYTGDDGVTNGFYVIAINAIWNKALQRWDKRDNALAAAALLFTYERIRISIVAVGTNTFNDWPINMPAGLASDWKGIHVVGDAVVNGNLYAPEGRFSVRAVAPEFAYSTPYPATTDPVYLDGALNTIFSTILGPGVWALDDAVSTAWFPLKIPRGVTPGSLRISFYQHTTDPAVFQIASRSVDFSPTGIGGVVSAGIVMTDIPGSSVTGPDDVIERHHVRSISLAAITFDHTIEYYVKWTPGDAGDYVNGMACIGTQAVIARTGLV